MKLAILLYGMFRHPRTVDMWAHMLPRGDIFLLATFLKYPSTQRSYDRGPVFSNFTFKAVDRAAAWSVIDQTAFDSHAGIEAETAALATPFNNDPTHASLKNAVRVIHQLIMLRDMFVSHKTNHTHAILTRVDLLFVRPVVAATFEARVVLPDYAAFGGYNDRFLAGPVKSVLLLMDRKDAWKRTGKLSEKLAKATCNAHNIVPYATTIGYSRRVRTGGSLHKAQYKHKGRCALDTAKSLSQLRPLETIIQSCNFLHPGGV